MVFPWLLVFIGPPFLMCWASMMHVSTRTARGEEAEALCSCEYMRSDGRGKAHVLDCFDECVLFQEWAGNCHDTPSSRRTLTVLLTVLKDHFRIPWIGGALRVPVGYLPLAIVPFFILFGGRGALCNAVQGIATSLWLLCATGNMMGNPGDTPPRALSF